MTYPATLWLTRRSLWWYHHIVKSPAKSRSLAGVVPALDAIVINTQPVAAKLDGTRLTDDFGDKWDIQTRRREYFICGEGRFVITFIELFKLMYERRIRGEARSVADWLCAHIASDNLVAGINQRQVTVDTGVTQSNVSKALSLLEHHGIALRDGPGKVLLNPRYCFLGKPTRQHYAVKEWDQKVADRRRAEMVADAEKMA